MQVFRQRFIIPFAYIRAAATVAVSEGINYELERFCGVKNVIAIPNYFDMGKISSEAAQPLPQQWEQLFTNLSLSSLFNDNLLIASAISEIFFFVTSNPVTSCCTISSGPPQRVAITGVP